MAPNALAEPTIIPERVITLRKPWYNDLVWKGIFFLLFIHLGTMYGIYLMITSASIKTSIFQYLYGVFGLIGGTAGAHRLWSHKAFKATVPLRIILAFLQTSIFQESIYWWVRNHRVHHKFSDTDADPHNANRGMFFAHYGWIMLKRHPQVFEQGKKVDVSDLLQDEVVVFQKRNYFVLSLFACFIFPTVVPMWFWGESFINAFFVAAMVRLGWTLNVSLLGNSLAHKYGGRPFDKSISPVNNLWLFFASNGEGWHNYHHAFPWDYKGAELGNDRLNLTTSFIDFFALLGWAYDLKTTSPEHVMKRAARTGDGTFVAPAVYPSMLKDLRA